MKKEVWNKKALKEAEDELKNRPELKNLRARIEKIKERLGDEART